MEVFNRCCVCPWAVVSCHEETQIIGTFEESGRLFMLPLSLEGATQSIGNPSTHGHPTPHFRTSSLSMQHRP